MELGVACLDLLADIGVIVAVLLVNTAMAVVGGFMEVATDDMATEAVFGRV